jgi:hypothetical protein
MDASIKPTRSASTSNDVKRPDPNDFDPLAEPWWTLPMVASWAIWRTADAVRDAWPKYRRELRHLNPEVSSAGQLPAAMEVFFSGDKEGVTARDRMWRALQMGELITTGLPAGSASRVKIDPSEWNDLDFSSGFNGTWDHDAIGRITETDPRYLAVLILATEAIAAFPPLEAGPALVVISAPAPKVEAGADEKAYLDWIAQHKEKRPPDRTADRDYMRSRISDITQVRLRELRRNLAPSEWTKPGRPQK